MFQKPTIVKIRRPHASLRSTDPGKGNRSLVSHLKAREIATDNTPTPPVYPPSTKLHPRHFRQTKRTPRGRAHHRRTHDRTKQAWTNHKPVALDAGGVAIIVYVQLVAMGDK